MCHDVCVLSFCHYLFLDYFFLTFRRVLMHSGALVYALNVLAHAICPVLTSDQFFSNRVLPDLLLA